MLLLLLLILETAKVKIRLINMILLPEHNTMILINVHMLKMNVASVLLYRAIFQSIDTLF